MINALQTAASFIDRKIGWSRIGLIVSLTIIAVALHTLFKLLQHIDIQKIIDAIREKQGREIAIAAGAVAAGYFTLTFYDLFALRTIGRSDIPYRIAALSGFTSYAVGHNIGATVLTGGAVRYRIYSAHGLDAVEVAKLCFVAGLTFWLGNATVLGLGILYVPGAAARVDQLPPSVNAVVAVIALIILAAYIVWVWSGRRTLGRGGWLVELPNGPSTLLQITIGIVDLSCCTLAMYMLLPDQPHIGFVTLAVIFVSATLLGFASHAPGGIGVFDAAMMIALLQYDKEDLVAGLLIFRFLYYACPFVLALVILGVREILLGIKPVRAELKREHAVIKSESAAQQLPVAPPQD